MGILRATTFAIPAILGVGVGALSVFDPFLGPGGTSGLDAVPYLRSVGLALALSFTFVLPFLLPGIRAREAPDRILLFVLIASVFLTGLPLYIGLLGLAAAYVLIFVRTAAGERCEVVWTPTYSFILLFAAATVLSLAVLGDLIRWILLATRRFVHIAFFLLFVNAIRTPPQLTRCLAMAFVLGVGSALIGIAQVLLFVQTGVLLTPQRAIFWNTPWWGAVPRAMGLFDHPNALGGTLGWFGVLLAFLGTCGAAAFTRKERVVFLGGSFLIFAAVFLSGSRGSWLGSAVALAIIPVVRNPSRTIQYALGALAGTAIAYATGLAPLLWEQVVRLNPASVDFRYYIAEVAWESIREHPLLGVGIENLETYNNPFRLPAHNLFLQVASELGLPMMLVFLVLLVSLVVRGIRAVRMALGRREALLLQGILLAFGEVLIHSQTDLFVYSKFFWFQLALLECAILICSRKGLPEAARPIFGR